MLYLQKTKGEKPLISLKNVLYFPVSTLKEAYKPLEKCVVVGQLVSYSKERSWTKFNKLMAAGKLVKSDLLPDQSLTFVAFDVFTNLLNRIWPPKEPLKVHNKTVKKRDYEILAYIGGSLLRKIKDHLRKHKRYEELRLIELLVCEPGDEGQEYGKLVRVKDRGGLTYLTQCTVELFGKIEAFFREKTENRRSYSIDAFLSEGLPFIEDDFMFAINETGDGGSFTPQVIHKVMTRLLKKFFTCRAHHRCKVLIEPIRLEHRKKGLRKSLKKKSK